MSNEASKSLDRMNKSELIEIAQNANTFAQAVPALVVDWTPKAFETMSADELVERATFVRTTGELVGDRLMLAGALTVWGAHFRGQVKKGGAFETNAVLAETLGKSVGYVSKARKIGRAYAEYGVQPGSELWTRITQFKLPENVRTELGKSPVNADGTPWTEDEIKSTVARWADEIEAYLAPVPAVESGSEDALEGAESGSDESPESPVDELPSRDVERIVATLVTILTGARTVSDLDTLQTLSESAHRLASLADGAIAEITAEPSEMAQGV